MGRNRRRLLGDKLVVVGLFQQLSNIFYRSALLEESTERLISQLAGDIFQRSQVFPWSIRGRNEQKEQIHFRSIQTLKVDTINTDANCSG